MILSYPLNAQRRLWSDWEKEHLRRKLFETCGIAHLDLNLILDAKRDEEYIEWRSVILTELETFIAKTKRFATRNSN